MSGVLMVSGSVRDGSVNSAVLRAAEDLLPSGVRAIQLDSLASLPHFNPDLDRDPLPVEVVRLRAAIAGASGLLFSTPEYAGTLPGALKNLLEWTVGGTEITDKPCGWINPSTGPTGAEGTYATLRVVLNYTGATVVDDACVRVPVPRSLIVDGAIADSAVRERIRESVDALTARIGM